MLALHLLQNSLVYINTLMLQQVLAQDIWQNRFTKEDWRALTPLFYLHINPYGEFSLDMTHGWVLRILSLCNWGLFRYGEKSNDLFSGQCP